MSYANVMSTIAVVLALGGGAYAASKTTSKQIKNNTIRSVDQKDRKAVQGVDVVPDSLTGAEILESSLAQVASAGSASHAATADNATNATNATNAEDADSADQAITAFNGAAGWARVSQGGIVTAGRSIQVADVIRQSEGIYCFDGLNFNPGIAVVTGDVASTNNAQDNFFAASTDGSSADCPGAEDAVVESRDEIGDDPTTDAILQDAGFFVVFFLGF